MSENEIERFAKGMFVRVMEYNKRIPKDERLTYEFSSRINLLGIRSCDYNQTKTGFDWFFYSSVDLDDEGSAEKISNDLDKFVKERYGIE